MLRFSSRRCGKGLVLGFLALLGAVSGAPHTPSRTKVSRDNIVENVHAQLHRFRAAQTNGREKNDSATADTTLDPSNTATMATAAVARPRSPHSVAKLHRLASNVEDRKKSHARLSQDTDERLRKLRAGLAHHTKNTDNRDRHRRLQTCAEGSGVTVTGSLFPLLEGCLAEMDVLIGGEVEFIGDSGMIASELDSDNDDAEYIWVAYYGTTSLAIACISLEPVTSVHPSTATWYCVDDTAEGGVVVATDTTFGVNCGCDDDATARAPTISTTPSPAVDATTPSAPSASTCTEGEPFTVAISALPEADGCFEATGIFLSDETVYTQSGGLDGAKMWVFGLPISEDVDAAIHWFLVDIPEIASSSELDGESETYCGSFEEASTVHPADANWVCSFASSSTQSFETDGASFTCGCSSDLTPEPPDPPLPEPTPEPIEPPLPEPTPEPVLATPEPVPTTPEPVSTTPEPTVSTAPKQVTPALVSEAVTPTPAASFSVAPTSGPTAGSRGLPVIPGPTSTPTSISPSPVLPVPTVAPIASPGVVPAPVSDNEASPSPSPENAPSSSTCGDTESFLITSMELPDIQGCFQTTSTSFSSPGSTGEFWSLTGEALYESVLVGAYLDEDTEEEDDDANVLYCYSNEQGILVHPADATWQCDLDGTGEYSDVTDEEVSFTCGCTGTPAPTPASSAIAAPESPSGTSPPVEPESDDGGLLGRRLSTSALVAGATSVLAIALALAVGG